METRLHEVGTIHHPIGKRETGSRRNKLHADQHTGFFIWQLLLTASTRSNAIYSDLTIIHKQLSIKGEPLQAEIRLVRALRPSFPWRISANDFFFLHPRSLTSIVTMT